MNSINIFDLLDFAVSHVKEPFDPEGTFDIGIVQAAEMFGDDCENINLRGKAKGTYTVLLETRLEMLYNVVSLSFGNAKGQLDGSCYVEGTRVLICYVSNMRVPIILGTLPVDKKYMYQVGGMTELDPGECIMQASPKKYSNIVPQIGGFVHCRSDGTVVIESNASGIASRLELGKRLIDNSTDDGIRCRLSVGGASVVIFNDGTVQTHTYNEINDTCQIHRMRVSKDGFESVEGNKTVYVGKNYIVNTLAGAFITINEDGNIQLSDKSGKNLIAFDATSGSEALTMVGGDGNYITMTLKEIDILAQETVKIASAEEISLKSKNVALDGQAVLVSGNKVALGDNSASKGVARKGDGVCIFCPVIGLGQVGRISNDQLDYTPGGDVSQKVNCS